MMESNRRLFLRDLAAAGVAVPGMVAIAPNFPEFLLSAARASEDSRNEKILVVVQLSGGNDGLNTVIPYRDERYRKNRPSLAIDSNSVVKVNDELGLHPSLRPFSKLLEENSLSILQGIGYPNPNRSHFESMDIWQSAHLEPDSRQTGWLGRAIDRFSEESHGPMSLPALHLGDGPQPLALAGRIVVSPSIRSLKQFRLDGRGDERFEQFVRESVSKSSDDGDLLSFIKLRASSAMEVSQRLRNLDDSSVRGFPQTVLGSRLEQVAQLIDAGLESKIYYVSLDGFDTHSDQLGAHNALLDQVANALSRFMAHLMERGNDQRVATLVFSEFGRRVQENSSRGTDHGAAAPVFVLGDKVSRSVIGDHPKLDDLDDGDLKFHTDFRSIYHSLLVDWLGLPVEDSLTKHAKIELFA